MPRAKKESKVKSSELRVKKAEKSSESSQKSGFNLDAVRNFRPNRTQLIGLGVLAIAGLLYLNKSWLVAATVNGQPISSFEVNRRLNSAYRQTILNEIINETVVEQEAAKKGVKVSTEEINNRLSEEEKAYGGRETFEAILAQQGITYQDYQRRTKLILLLEKMYSTEINPTDDEIKKFMSENSNLPEATDEAKYKSLAESSLKQQKFTSIIGEKFPQLKQSADIKIF